MSEDTKYWVVIPAAGVGTRMDADIPKQYIPVYGKTILEHTLDCFLQREDINSIVVAIAENDKHWSSLSVSSDPRVITTQGGAERYQSVLNGLKVLSGRASENDWVMVHDAARPCLHQSAIDRLMVELDSHPVGGILALQCADTMKRANAENEIEGTVERENLWRAQTPQMFRYKKLLLSLETALENNMRVTDEAMAIELAGLKPKLIDGHQENIKITKNDDLSNAENYLKMMSL